MDSPGKENLTQRRLVKSSELPVSSPQLNYRGGFVVSLPRLNTLIYIRATS